MVGGPPHAVVRHKSNQTQRLNMRMPAPAPGGLQPSTSPHPARNPGPQMTGLDLQLEGQRKRVDELNDTLVRKREKKRRWKRLFTESDKNVMHLKV
jgi:hypothetical protein